MFHSKVSKSYNIIMANFQQILATNAMETIGKNCKHLEVKAFPIASSMSKFKRLKLPLL